MRNRPERVLQSMILYFISFFEFDTFSYNIFIFLLPPPLEFSSSLSRRASQLVCTHTLNATCMHIIEPAAIPYTWTWTAYNSVFLVICRYTLIFFTQICLRISWKKYRMCTLELFCWNWNYSISKKGGYKWFSVRQPVVTLFLKRILYLFLQYNVYNKYCMNGFKFDFCGVVVPITRVIGHFHVR